MKTEFKDEWKQLNEYQMAAVRDESPACVVNANVGSGKTTVLIAKILYLCYEKQVPLEDMIVLTFTNKAADEIVGRLLQKEPSLDRERVRGFGTFHGVALYLLKNRLPIESTGWNRDFVVIDPDEEVDLAQELMVRNGLKIKYKNRLKKRLEQEYGAYLRGAKESRYRDDLFLLYPALQEEKIRQNKMSFFDLLRVSTRLLREERGQNDRPQWIIVDEVQDSDEMQIEFLEALKGEETKIFAVGDPNQVIYSWRGTGQNMFFLLKHRFAAKELSLPINYRSNASILEAANRFLEFGDKIQGSRGAGEKIQVKNHYDPFQEAEYLAERIQEMHEEGTPYGEIAVCYRLQKQSELLEKVLERKKIPYETAVKKTVRDVPVLDYLVKLLRFAANPADEQIGMQVLADVRYGEKCTKKKAKEIVEGHLSEKSELYRRMVEFGQKADQEMGEEGMFRYFGLREALHPTSADYAKDEKLAKDFLHKVCEFCRKEGGDGERFAEGVRAFVNHSALYGGSVTAEEEGRSKDAVRLMTLHASKGLEFETVFLIGVNQGLVPLRCKSFEEEEEERRLFFVGMTRARNRLEISYYTNPGEPGVLGEYSRFLRMIPPQLLCWEELRSEEQKKENLQQLRKEVQERIRVKMEQESEIQEAEEPEKSEEQPVRARHPKYGEGVLVSEDAMSVEIEFEGYGRKKFLKAFGEVEMI